MTKIICVGIATQDFVYGLDAIPTTAEKHRAHSLAVSGGGLSGNASAAMARLGAKVTLYARLGDDLVGRDIVAELEEDGVDCSKIRLFPGIRSAVSAILVDKAGERMVVSYSDPNLPTDPSWLPKKLPPGTVAVLGDTRWEQGAARFFEQARAMGIPSVLDGDRAARVEGFTRLPSHVAFAAQAVREITGEHDPLLGLRRLRAEGHDNWLAVTVGAQGVFYLDGDEIAHVPAFPITAVDTLGAGDVWHGAFTLALAERMPEREAIRFASAAAAIKCTRFGGRLGAPTRAEVESFLAEKSA